MLTVAEVSELLHRGSTYVKDHAESFGGQKIAGKWRFPLNEIEQIRQAEQPAERVPTPT